MPVYVDIMRSCLPTKNWRYKENCHLVADTLEELHDFAKKIGMKLTWFQNKSSLPHYDLVRKKRELAVSLGAIEITNRQMYERILEYRKTNNIKFDDKT